MSTAFKFKRGLFLLYIWQNCQLSPRMETFSLIVVQHIELTVSFLSVTEQQRAPSLLRNLTVAQKCAQYESPWLQDANVGSSEIKRVGKGYGVNMIYAHACDFGFYPDHVFSHSFLLYCFKASIEHIVCGLNQIEFHNMYFCLEDGLTMLHTVSLSACQDPISWLCLP